MNIPARNTPRIRNNGNLNSALVETLIPAFWKPNFYNESMHIFVQIHL